MFSCLSAFTVTKQPFERYTSFLCTSTEAFFISYFFLLLWLNLLKAFQNLVKRNTGARKRLGCSFISPLPVMKNNSTIYIVATSMQAVTRNRKIYFDCQEQKMQPSWLYFTKLESHKTAQRCQPWAEADWEVRLSLEQARLRGPCGATSQHCRATEMNGTSSGLQASVVASCKLAVVWGEGTGELTPIIITTEPSGPQGTGRVAAWAYRNSASS